MWQLFRELGERSSYSKDGADPIGQGGSDALLVYAKQQRALAQANEKVDGGKIFSFGGPPPNPVESANQSQDAYQGLVDGGLNEADPRMKKLAEDIHNGDYQSAAMDIKMMVADQSQKLTNTVKSMLDTDAVSKQLEPQIKQAEHDLKDMKNVLDGTSDALRSSPQDPAKQRAYDNALKNYTAAKERLTNLRDEVGALKTLSSSPPANEEVPELKLEPPPDSKQELPKVQPQAPPLAPKDADTIGRAGLIILTEYMNKQSQLQSADGLADNLNKAMGIPDAPGNADYKAGLAQDAYKSLLDSGLKESDPRMQKLATDIQNKDYGAASEDIKVLVKDKSQILKDSFKGLINIDAVKQQLESQIKHVKDLESKVLSARAELDASPDDPAKQKAFDNALKAYDAERDPWKISNLTNELNALNALNTPPPVKQDPPKDPPQEPPSQPPPKIDPVIGKLRHHIIPV